MSGPTQKPPPTLADYKAAVEDLRAARAAAAEAVNVAHAEGDVAKGADLQSQLKEKFDAFRSFRDGLPRDVLLSIHADRILESFAIEEERGWKSKIGALFGRAPVRRVCLVIPTDVSDEDAMHALNARFREMFPDKKRAAIYEPDIEEILDAGSGSGRASRAPRIIRLIGVVPGTTNMKRDQQAEALQRKGLKFPHPIEQALAAAAYACKRSGEDLFNGYFVRGSFPGFALFSNLDGGVDVYGYNDVNGCNVVAASGSPSPELKNLDR